MGKKLSTWNSKLCDDYCEIHVNLKEEYFYIKWFGADKKMYHTEDFIGKSLHYVEDAAENWTVGIKKIEKSEINGLQSERTMVD